MRRPILYLSGLFMCLISCAGNTAQPLASLPVSDAPDRAYHRAVRMLTAKGGLLSTNDPQTRTVQAHISGTKIVTMQVSPSDGGSRIEARCQMALGIMNPLFGSCDAHEYLKAYQETH